MSAPSMHADSKACGTCKSLVGDGKPIEHEQCAARAVLLLPPDQPMYEDLVDLTDEQRKALPARFHTPVFDGLGQPNAWLCQVCWGDGWVSRWPCGPAQQKGALVFVSEVAAEDIAAELVRLRARVAELEAQANCPSQMTVSSGTSRCALPVRHGGDHRNAEKNHHWSDEYADAARVRPTEAEDSYERKVAEYLATPYTDDVPRDLRPGAEAARRMLRDRPAAEDPHDSPLHHTYALGRDLPEVTP